MLLINGMALTGKLQAPVKPEPVVQPESVVQIVVPVVQRTLLAGIVGEKIASMLNAGGIETVEELLPRSESEIFAILSPGDKFKAANVHFVCKALLWAAGYQWGKQEYQAQDDFPVAGVIVALQEPELSPPGGVVSALYSLGETMGQVRRKSREDVLNTGLLHGEGPRINEEIYSILTGLLAMVGLPFIHTQPSAVDDLVSLIERIGPDPDNAEFLADSTKNPSRTRAVRLQEFDPTADISVLGFDHRALDNWRRHGVNLLGDFERVSPEQFADFYLPHRERGVRYADEIRVKLEALGYSWGKSTTAPPAPVSAEPQQFNPDDDISVLGFHALTVAKWRASGLNALRDFDRITPRQFVAWYTAPNRNKARRLAEAAQVKLAERGYDWKDAEPEQPAAAEPAVNKKRVAKPEIIGPREFDPKADISVLGFHGRTVNFWESHGLRTLGDFDRIPPICLEISMAITDSGLSRSSQKSGSACRTCLDTPGTKLKSPSSLRRNPKSLLLSEWFLIRRSLGRENLIRTMIFPFSIFIH